MITKSNNSLFENNFEYLDNYLLHIRQIEEFDILNQEEEINLAYKIKNGDKKAKLIFINANLRLVISIAKKIYIEGNNLKDMIQNGYIGLIHAVNKFNPDKGFKFSTYATWIIRQAIYKGIANEQNTLAIPIHLFASMQKIIQTQKRLTELLSREPLIDELAQELNMETNKIEEIMNSGKEILSLDKSIIKDENKGILRDFIEDNVLLSASKEIDKIIIKENLYEMLNILTPQEQEIITYRFGLNDKKILTYPEIGEKYNVSSERIRQIEKKIFEKIRRFPGVERLRDNY